MFEIDKICFGKFLAEQRKKKGYTQKEVAQKLLVSDKAVSKWETGNSLPDISLLIPLAELLDVTVTELLEGQRLQTETELKPDHVENLVKKVLALSDDTPEKVKQKKRKKLYIYAGGLITAFLILLIIHMVGISAENLSPNFFIIEIFSMFFGAYFWIFIREKLPTYFDEHKISAYSDVFFRMNIPGVYFNNSNWPHIVYVGRLWTILCMILYPVICLCGFIVLKESWSKSITIHLILLIIVNDFLSCHPIAFVA